MNQQLVMHLWINSWVYLYSNELQSELDKMCRDKLSKDIIFVLCVHPTSINSDFKLHGRITKEETTFNSCDLLLTNFTVPTSYLGLYIYYKKYILFYKNTKSIYKYVVRKLILMISYNRLQLVRCTPVW